MTRLLAAGLAALLCVPVLSETVPLRIVTFNAEILTAPRVRAGQLQKFRFDYAREKHLERVAAVIETLTPDVLNLVEVTSREAVDALIAILHEKGLDDYRGYHVESNDGFSGMDVGVISRLPLDEVDGKTIRTIYSPKGDPTWSQAFSFTGFDGERKTSGTSLSRNSLYFLSVNGWKLGFLGLHLKSNPSDEYSNAKRTAETELVRRVIRGEIVPKGYLPLVLGDLNDYDPSVPDRDEGRSTLTKTLTRIKDYDSDSPGDELVNAAKWVPRKADRYTSHWDWNENGAADGDDVFTMIDHVLLPKQLEPHVKRVFICHTVGLDTSDHFPVVVDLSLPAFDE
ncbi:MAG: endonuclease/exonuclease/phosphatase family protein [Planctomycetota bacterium]